MALRIEKAFGPDMDHLLRLQLAYDVAKTHEHRDIVVKRYAPARDAHLSACASDSSPRQLETVLVFLLRE